MNVWGPFNYSYGAPFHHGHYNESYGGPLHHGHFNPWIYTGLPITQVGHHRGAQVVGGFSATDPW